MVLGATAWFGGLTVAAAIHGSNTGFLDRDGRALSAAAFAAIAFGSLAFMPAIEHYTRRPRAFGSWDDRVSSRQRRDHVDLGEVHPISLGYVVGTSIGTPKAFTVFHWVVPIALGADRRAPDPICLGRLQRRRDVRARPDERPRARLGDTAAALDGSLTRNQ